MKPQRWMARVGLVLGFAVFVHWVPAGGQQCPEELGQMGVEFWHSSPSRFQVSGSHAYLVGDYWVPPRNTASFIAITDVSDFEGPRIVGRVMAGEVIDLSVSRDLLYVLSEDCGRSCWTTLNITDVSEPERPEPLLTRYEIDRRSSEISVSGNTVFIASPEGLSILDATDPSKPVEEGYLASLWDPSDLAVEGGVAYVILPEEGLRIIDVSDPANPVEVGSLEATWNAVDLDVSDGFAYVADGEGGLRVIDASNPTEPTEVGVLNPEHGVVSVSVDGSHAAVGLADKGIAIVDVTNKSDPEIVGSHPIEEAKPDVALVGSTAFAIGDGFLVMDVSIPESPTEMSSFDFRSSAIDVAVSNGVKYVASGDSGLYVLDQSNPDETLEGFLDTPGFALGVTLYGHFALVADDHKGVRIIDVSDPENLVEVGFVDTPGQARRVAVAGNRAYVADGDGGLRIVDISLPATPVEIGAIDTSEPATDVAIAGDYAYVAAQYLRIIDVSDPTHPFAVDTSEPIYTRTVAIENELLYLVGNRFRIYCLSNPSEPQLLERGAYMGDEAMDITLSGHHAFVATRRDDLERPAGLEVIDILNPYFPSRVAGWEFEGDAWGVAVSDGRVYLAVGQPGVVILDNRCLTTYWVEIVAHANGLHGSQWRSDVIISHEAERRVAFDFILHTIEGEFTAGASVETGHQGVFEDIVGLLGYEGTGALEIQATHPITITSRVYSEMDPGTFGAFLQGYRSSDCFGDGKLYGLRQVEGEFRTNISITNTTDETRQVGITLYRTDGTELIRYSLEVEPGMVVQDVQPFKDRAGQPNLGWGFATVNGGKGILACASVIDSRTNDALIVPLVR